MLADRFPVGRTLEVTYPAYSMSLTCVSDTRMTFEVRDGARERCGDVRIQAVPLRDGLFAISWQDADGATVTSIKDFDRQVARSFITSRDGTFVQMSGAMTFACLAECAPADCPASNKELVREAMIALYQRRDASAVDRFFAPDYVQHDPSIPQGRAALKDIIRGLAPDAWYEPGLMIAEGDLVVIRGRLRGWTLVPRIVVSVFRIENGLLAEHWDVMEDEVRSPFGGIAKFDPAEDMI